MTSSYIQAAVNDYFFQSISLSYSGQCTCLGKTGKKQVLGCVLLGTGPRLPAAIAAAGSPFTQPRAIR